MRKKGWVYFVISLIGALIFFTFVALVSAEPAWKKALREDRSGGRKTRIECHVSGYRYMRKGNKVVKVPVTVCEER